MSPKTEEETVVRSVERHTPYVVAFAAWLRRHDALAGAHELAAEIEEEGAAVLAELLPADPAASAACAAIVRIRRSLAAGHACADRSAEDVAVLLADYDAEHAACTRLWSKMATALDRIRTVTQVLVAEVGAEGPLNLEEAAQRAVARLESMAVQRAEAEAERDRLREENTRLATMATHAQDLLVERNHYRERATTHGRRLDWMQSVTAAAMRQGLDACHRLRRQVAYLQARLREESWDPQRQRNVLRVRESEAKARAAKVERDAADARLTAALFACGDMAGLRARFDWAQHVAAEAMREGLACAEWQRLCLASERARGDAARRAATLAETAHDGLQAMVEGRTVAPTPQEIAAHGAAGGSWTTYGGSNAARYPTWLSDPGHVRSWAEGEASDAAMEPPPTPMRWWAHGRDRRLCPWPTVAAEALDGASKAVPS